MRKIPLAILAVAVGGLILALAAHGDSFYSSPGAGIVWPLLVPDGTPAPQIIGNGGDEDFVISTNGSPGQYRPVVIATAGGSPLRVQTFDPSIGWPGADAESQVDLFRVYDDHIQAQGSLKLNAIGNTTAAGISCRWAGGLQVT
ncbi:MAG TPA: hypothetical protein VHF22_02790, partial [Planctomycetota bacterium]|nr:hypothetical protein [Planctomycetota bacterium]